MPNLIKIKRGIEANLPTLQQGEPAFTTDTQKVFIGTGVGNIRIDFTAAERTKLNGIEEGADVTTFTKVSNALAGATSDVSFNNKKITSLATPTNPTDAATKAYVDNTVTGFDAKASCRVATTGNITLSGTQMIDGVNVVVGDRVLVKDQTIQSQNGIYVVSNGAWSRASDADSNEEVTAGMYVFITQGTVNGDRGFLLITDDPITLGTTGLVFTQFSAMAAGAGNFDELTDTPSSKSTHGLKIVRVNSAETALEYVSFGAYLEGNPSNGESNKAPTSNWAYSHAIATTGIHGAGSNTLIHTGSTIDGGVF